MYKMLSEQFLKEHNYTDLPVRATMDLLANKMREVRHSLRRIWLGVTLAGLLTVNMALGGCTHPVSTVDPVLATRIAVMDPYIEGNEQYLANGIQALDLQRLESEAPIVNSTSFHLRFMESSANMYAGECSGGGINIHGNNYVITANHCLLSTVPITKIELTQPHIQHSVPIIVKIVAERAYEDLDIRIFRVDTGGQNFPEVEVNSQGYLSHTPVVSINAFPNGKSVSVVNMESRVLESAELKALEFNTTPQKWLVPVTTLSPGSSGAAVFDNTGKLIGTLVEVVDPSKGVPLGALFVENPNLSVPSNLP